MDGCLVCGKSKVDKHHWPRTRAVGGTATVPLCREHHDAAHWGSEYVIDLLTARAPERWRQEGTWEANRADYWRYLDRRQYREVIFG